jgi:YVTN family beta-propeller protein
MDWVSVSLRGLAAVAFVCAFACFAAANAGAAPLALATNYEAGTVSVINTQTNQAVGKPIEVGGRPKSIAITPDARFAYVVNEESDDVSVIELATRQVVGEPIPVGFEPGQIAISPDGRTAYVADLFNESLTVIDTRTNRVTGEVGLNSNASGIAFAPDGKTAYVAEENAEAVEVIVTQYNEATETIALAESPLGISISPDGKTLYVGDELAGLATIDTATGKVKYVPIGSSAGEVTLAPDGKTALVSQWLAESVSLVDLRTGVLIKEILVSQDPGMVALTPDGRFGYVVLPLPEHIRVIDTQTLEAVGPPIAMSGGVSEIAIAPDQSPTAAFTSANATATVPTTFDGAGSTDPDGSVASYSWAFGDGGTATGISPLHTYAASGTYNASLSVLDNEGCGVEEVFTGRTAYCSGSPLAKVTHPVEAKVPPVPAPVCSAKFAIGGVSHNRRNGTVRVRLKFHSAGSFLLFGKKIHAVTRKVRRPGSTVVTLHARVELNKRLKKKLRAQVRYRVTFTPAAGCGSKTVHRAVALLRAPRHRHRG